MKIKARFFKFLWRSFGSQALTNTVLCKILSPLNVLVQNADMSRTGRLSEMHVPCEKHHQVSSMLKVHQNVHNSAQYEVLVT